MASHAESVAERDANPRRSPHGLLPLVGRDPGESARAGSALELIFDLVAVVAVSIAASNLGELLSEGHVAQGIGTFMFAVFGITWAWSTYSQLLSAFDTDDWGVRLVTLMQMFGVLVLALGISPMVASVDAGHTLNNQIMVVGYVIMRVGAIILWLRVARSSEKYRKMAMSYVWALVISQAGWCLQAFLPLSPQVGMTVMGIWLLQEVFYPLVADRRQAMPWHPHHMGERLGAFAIITLGEVVLGTLTAVQADVAEFGWTATAVAVGVAGLTLAFGLWWVYFILPTGEALEARPKLLPLAILIHILLYACIAAAGAGLHLSATYVEGEGHVSLVGAALAVAIPASLAVILIFGLFHALLRGFDGFHLAMIVATLALAGLGVWLAAAAAPLSVVVCVIMLIPWVSVVGYEVRGHRTLNSRVEATRAAFSGVRGR